MQNYISKYKIRITDFLIFLAITLPFFDWKDDLISFGGFFYLNVFKLLMIIFFIFLIPGFKKIKKNDLSLLIPILIISTIFLIHHNSFINLKGYVFVLILFLLFFNNIKIEVISNSLNSYIKFLILLIFFFSLIEISLNIKFITPDFRDNIRNIIGLDIRRVSFTFTDPNYLGYHIGLLFFLLQKNSKDKNYLFLIFTFLIILFTGSRGALIAIVITLFHNHIIRFLSYLRKKYSLKPFLFILFLFLIIQLTSLYETYLSSFQDFYLNAEDSNKTILTRVILYLSGLITLYNFPVFGIGHGRVGVYPKSNYLPIELPNDVNFIIDEMGFHNYFLEFFVENGAILGFVFLFVFWKSFKRHPKIILFSFLFMLTSGYESPLLYLFLIL